MQTTAPKISVRTNIVFDRMVLCLKDTVSNNNKEDKVHDGQGRGWISNAAPRTDTIVHDSIPILPCENLMTRKHSKVMPRSSKMQGGRVAMFIRSKPRWSLTAGLRTKENLKLLVLKVVAIAYKRFQI